MSPDDNQDNAVFKQTQQPVQLFQNVRSHKKCKKKITSKSGGKLKVQQTVDSALMRVITRPKNQLPIYGETFPLTVDRQVLLAPSMVTNCTVME